MWDIPRWKRSSTCVQIPLVMFGITLKLFPSTSYIYLPNWCVNVFRIQDPLQEFRCEKANPESRLVSSFRELNAAKFSQHPCFSIELITTAAFTWTEDLTHLPRCFSMLHLSLARTFYVSHLAKAKLKSLYFRVTEFWQHHENIN